MPTPPQSDAPAPATVYTARRARFAERRDHYDRRGSLNGNLSLALVASALLLLGLALWRRSPDLLLLAGLLGACFVVSFVHHGRINRLRQRYATLWEINEEGLRRLRRDWDALPLRQSPDIAAAYERPEVADYAADLDLIGHASLMHLLGTASTPVGQATLARWLLRPATPATIRERQAAVAELAPLADFRDEFALRGRRVGATQPGYQAFARWAAGPPWLVLRPWLLWLARLLPLAAVVGGVIQLAGLTDLPIWAPFVIANTALTLTIGRRVDQLIDAVAERQEACRTYADLFCMIGAQRFAAPLLREIQSRLAAGGLSAEAQMRRLARLMVLADLRGWMFFFVIQVLTLWNVHVLWLLERWQRVGGAHAPDWLAALGETEALIALATLAHDNPAWTFPEVAEDQPLLAARGLGHPLLPETLRVDNDVTVGPPGTFLLVTGSNMSGKSTLLRAIGVNVTLAQAGGPVCATELRLPPLELATSMRVRDSLEQGISSFMAELRRLKAVVEAAERVRTEGGRTLLFLLDEILHGTNTAERQIAARRVIRHLLACGATGAVSTHDLTLADDPALAAASQPVHFTETFEPGPDGPVMRFDYRLRPGVATSTNALALVRQILGPAVADAGDAPL
ncbi:MAG: MutS-related protein [Roseiflexaceae bacterium]